MQKNTQNTHFSRIFSNLLPYVKPFRLRAMLAILITIPVGMMDAIIAWSLKAYMDVVMIEKDLTASSYIPILIISFSFLQSCFNYTATYLNAWIGAKISYSLKIDLFRKLMRSSASFFDQSTSGTIQHRFNNDVDSACNGFTNHAKLLSTRIFSSISLTSVLLINSWMLAVVAISVLAIALLPLKSIRKKIKGIMAKTVFSGSEVMTHFSEAFSGNRVVSSYNLYEYQSKKLSKSLQDVFVFYMKMIQRTGIVSPLLHFLVAIGVAIIIWLGSYLIVSGQLSPGGFVSFITALLLLYHPIKSIGDDFNALQMSLMAMERVFDLLNTPDWLENSPQAKDLTSIETGIKYRNVGFEYTHGKRVLENISLDVKKGETIAFVGGSGGGKTTLLNLLPRFYEVTSGKILIDDTDIRDIKINALREKIAIVFQDNFLFSGTIRDNILLGNIVATQDEIDQAITSACLNDFLRTLDLGLDTVVGEQGVLLSGGQKQRVAIARAFLKNAPIVILDEATSALDNKSETVVQKAIDNLMQDRTVLIIAHRLSTIKNADKIFVINNGRIVECGKHEDLIKNTSGEYFALYNDL